MTVPEQGESPDQGHRWLAMFVGVIVAVASSIAVTALTPLGEDIREMLFPTRASVVGRVQVEVTGAPVSGAGVTVSHKSTETGSDGSFAITGLGRGAYSLSVHHPAAAVRQVRFVVHRGQDRVDLGDVLVQPAYTLRYEVQDFSAAFWVDGQPSALQRVEAATYAFPDSWGIAPVTVTGADLCALVFAEFLVSPATTDVSVVLELEQAQVELTSATDATRRPSGCRSSHPPVPEVTGLALEEAQARLAASGFVDPRVEEIEVNCPAQVGTVLASRPPSGHPWPLAQSVQLRVGAESGFLARWLRSPLAASRGEGWWC